MSGIIVALRRFRIVSGIWSIGFRYLSFCGGYVSLVQASVANVFNLPVSCGVSFFLISLSPLLVT